MGPEEERVPPGVLEGIGSADVSLNTPDFMRDCIQAKYWDRPSQAELHKAAVRLADDFKRRGFPRDWAERTILCRFSSTFPLLKRDQFKQVERGVRWVYEEQTSGLSCSGSLSREGVCFRHSRTCHFFEAEQRIRKAGRRVVPDSLPREWCSFLETGHPSEALFAEWAYLELAAIESEKNIIPGDPRTPIYVGFRALADRVLARRRTQCFTKDTAVRTMHLLEDIGLVRKVVQGSRGTMRREANGYCRTVPLPQPPAPAYQDLTDRMNP